MNVTSTVWLFFSLPLTLTVQVLIIHQQLVTTKTAVTKTQRAHKHGSTYKNGNANCVALQWLQAEEVVWKTELKRPAMLNCTDTFLAGLSPGEISV